MPLRTDAYYRKLAGETLRSADMTEPPVSLEALARSLGVPVLTGMFPHFFSGAIVNEDGLPVVLLNMNRIEEARRAALAHMLGHLVVILDDPSSRYPRDAVFEHHEADVVADELVAPTFMVIEQARKWFNDYRYLARLFAVPESDMLEKMRDMGLIQERGLYWDY